MKDCRNGDGRQMQLQQMVRRNSGKCFRHAKTFIIWHVDPGQSFGLRSTSWLILWTNRSTLWSLSPGGKGFAFSLLYIAWVCIGSVLLPVTVRKPSHHHPLSPGNRIDPGVFELDTPNIISPAQYGLYQTRKNNRVCSVFMSISIYVINQSVIDPQIDR